MGLHRRGLESMIYTLEGLIDEIKAAEVARQQFHSTATEYLDEISGMSQR